MVAFLLYCAAKVESFPATDTATETPWIAPSVCKSGPNKFITFDDAADQSRMLGETVAVDDRQQCPPGVKSASVEEFVLPHNMQGWPTGTDAEVSLVVYHDDLDEVSLTVELSDASGRTLLEGKDITFAAVVADQSLDDDDGNDDDGDDDDDHHHHGRGMYERAHGRTPGRVLKGGGGGGGHGHSARRGGHGVHHAASGGKRPATSLPRYSSTPSRPTRYGRHWRGAVTAGVVVFSVHHSGQYGRHHCHDYSRGGCHERIQTDLARDILSGLGSFPSGGGGNGSQTWSFPLLLRVAAEVRRPAHDAWPPGAPSIFLTLYSATGGASGANERAATNLRGLVWLPLFFSVFALLQRLMPVRAMTVDGLVLFFFLAVLICASGYQIQLWVGGDWAKGQGELSGATGL